MFIGHGSPMNAIEENEFVEGWRIVGKMLPRPAAILCPPKATRRSEHPRRTSMMSSSSMLRHDPRPHPFSSNPMTTEGRWYFALSLDGTQEQHDLCRSMPNQKGSYEKVAGKINDVLAFNPYTIAISVIVPETI